MAMSYPRAYFRYLLIEIFPHAVPERAFPHAGIPAASLRRMPTKKGTKVILVAGATGQQGGASMRRLRASGFSIRALTRDPDQPRARSLTGPGIEVVRGDMNDRNSLASAL